MIHKAKTEHLCDAIFHHDKFSWLFLQSDKKLSTIGWGLVLHAFFNRNQWKSHELDPELLKEPLAAGYKAVKVYEGWLEKDSQNIAILKLALFDSMESDFCFLGDSGLNIIEVNHLIDKLLASKTTGFNRFKF